MKSLKQRLRERDDVDCVRASYRLEQLEKALEELLGGRMEDLEEEANTLSPYIILLNEDKQND
jgi:hypothetical protein